MGAMNTDEMTAYLAQPLVANFVTLRRGGSPHVAPVWYAFDNGNFFVYTSRNSQRARNLERDNRAAISIAACAEPYAYVIAEGKATLSSQDAARIGRAIATRYMGDGDSGKIEQFMTETLNDSTVVIELAPERIMSWSDAGEDA